MSVLTTIFAFCIFTQAFGVDTLCPIDYGVCTEESFLLINNSGSTIDLTITSGNNIHTMNGLPRFSTPQSNIDIIPASSQIYKVNVYVTEIIAPPQNYQKINSMDFIYKNGFTYSSTTVSPRLNIVDESDKVWTFNSDPVNGPYFNGFKLCGLDSLPSSDSGFIKLCLDPTSRVLFQEQNCKNIILIQQGLSVSQPILNGNYGISNIYQFSATYNSLLNCGPLQSSISQEDPQINGLLTTTDLGCISVQNTTDLSFDYTCSFQLNVLASTNIAEINIPYNFHLTQIFQNFNSNRQVFTVNNLTFTDMCLNTLLQPVVNGSIVKNMTVVINFGVENQEFVIKDSVSIFYGNGTDICPIRNYSVSQYGWLPSAPFYDVNITPFSLPIGTYPQSLRVFGYSGDYMDYYFNIYIVDLDCVIPPTIPITITQQVLPSILLPPTSIPFTITYNSISKTPGCGPITATIKNANISIRHLISASFQTCTSVFNSTDFRTYYSCSFTLDTESTKNTNSFDQIYPFNINFNFNDFPANNYTTTGYNLNLTNLCLTTQLQTVVQGSIVSNLTSDYAAHQNTFVILDSVSLMHGNGTNICQIRNYSFGTFDWFKNCNLCNNQTNKFELNVYESQAYLYPPGSYLESLTVYAYNSNLTYPFYVNFQLCPKVWGMQGNSSYWIYQYQLLNLTHNMTDLYKFMNATCPGHNLAFTVIQNSNLTFFNYTIAQPIQAQYNAYTTKRSDTGNYQFELIVNETNNGLSMTYYYELDVLDICETTIISIKSPIQTIYGMFGYPAPYQLLKFEDSISNKFGMPFYCDNYNYSFTQTPNLQFSSDDQLKFITSSRQNFVKYIQFNTTLPLSASNFSQTFKLVQVDFIDQILHNYTFKVNNKPILININNFVLEPSFVNAMMPPKKLEAYLIKAGSILYSPINKALLSSIPAWLELNGNQFTIVNPINNDQGDYTVAVLQQFDGIDGYAFSLFNIEIIPYIYPDFDVPLLKSYLIQPTGISKITLPGYQNYAISFKLNGIDQSYFSFLNDTITLQPQLKPGNFRVSVTLTNFEGFSSEFLFEIIKQKPLDYIIQNITFVNKTKTAIFVQEFTYDQNPIKIIDISQIGVVTFRFSRKIIVPTNSTLFNEMINQTVLDLKMTNDSITFIQPIKNWTTVNITEYQLKIQIFFDNPLDISYPLLDQLQATVLNNSIFLLLDSGFLLNQTKQYTMQYIIPPQFLTLDEYNKAQGQIKFLESTSYSTVAITLVAQLVGKNVISKVWLFYCAVQLFVYMNKNACFILPPSSFMVIKALDDIISLNGLDKDQIAAILAFEKYKDSPLYSNLGGIGISIIFIVLGAMVIGIFIMICKSPKMKTFFNKIKNMLCWNFFIRYLYASFINFSNSSILTLQSNASIFEKVISALILATIYIVLFLLIKKLYKSNHYWLSLATVQLRIGMMYQNLKLELKATRIYSLLFFVQRQGIVLIVIFVSDYGFQQVLLQMALMGHTIYLLHNMPYKTFEFALPDYLSEIFLLLVFYIQLSVSPYQTNSKLRYELGQNFTAAVVIFFVLNFTAIFYKITTDKIRAKKLESYKKKQVKNLNQKLDARKAKFIEKMKKSIVTSGLVQSEVVEDLDDQRPHIEEIDFKNINSMEQLYNTIARLKVSRHNNKLVEQSKLNEILQQPIQQPFLIDEDTSIWNVVRNMNNQSMKKSSQSISQTQQISNTEDSLKQKPKEIKELKDRKRKNVDKAQVLSFEYQMEIFYQDKLNIGRRDVPVLDQFKQRKTIPIWLL